jgi:hypothetical protein
MPDNDNGGASAPSRRDDRQYTITADATYAITAHLGASVTYSYDLGDNALASLPASLQPACRNFDHQIISLGVKYKF